MIPIHKKLPEHHHFRQYGYKIYKNSTVAFDRLKSSFTDYLRNELEQFGGIKIPEFSLKNYHKHLIKFQIDHHAFITKIGRKIPHSVLDIEYIDKLIDIANEDFDAEFGIYRSNIEFRVVRPSNEDNNDLHRDHWFPYFTPLVNIYLPMQNSHFDSAMGIIPFSHEWSESDVVPTFTYEESKAGKKYIKNGIAYSVPGIKAATKPLNLHRPDIVEGDFMLFSPKLVHGGGSNFSDGTRFSFEIRLEPIARG